MTRDYYILKILATIMDDPIYKKVYAREVKMLLGMLVELNSSKLS